MLARLLFAMPPRRLKQWIEADVDAATEAALAAMVERLYSLTASSGDTGQDPPRLVFLDENAKHAWIQYYNRQGEEHSQLCGDLAAAWSKLEGYAARLALVIHMIRWAANDPAIPTPETPMDETSIAAGVTLSRWFGHEARRVYTMLAEEDDDRENRELVELVQRKSGSISARELVQASRAFPVVAAAEAALSRLVELGVGTWVTPEQRGRGGPKARRFVLSPVYGVNVYRNTAGGTENANPVGVDGVDNSGGDEQRGGDGL